MCVKCEGSCVCTSRVLISKFHVLIERRIVARGLVLFRTIVVVVVALPKKSRCGGKKTKARCCTIKKWHTVTLQLTYDLHVRSTGSNTVFHWRCTMFVWCVNIFICSIVEQHPHDINMVTSTC